jgi:hypothetical protein
MKPKPIRLPLTDYTLQTIANGCRTTESRQKFLRSEIKWITEAYRWGLIERWQALFALADIRNLLPCSRK